MGSVDETSEELPLPPYASAEDVGFAVRAIVVHGEESGRDGPVCRHDLFPYPCRLHRWGRAVLARRGLTDAQVADLVKVYVRGQR